MICDFTLKKYEELLINLIENKMVFQTFSQYISNPLSNVIILRHDVDKCPENSLKFAIIQAKYGIVGSYYFRCVSHSCDKKTIKDIYDLGHEIGYHYESLATCKGNMELAIEDFKFNLNKLREIVPVTTICMHGSPRSPWDSKDIWGKYNYREYGIIGEPYFDINFDNVFYLSDTGRRWNGWRSSVRDKIIQQDSWIKEDLIFHSTNDIIHAINNDIFPNNVMITFHPQRWEDRPIPWLKELIMQNTKNILKIMLVKKQMIKKG